jgi:hypothetical protein
MVRRGRCRRLDEDGDVKGERLRDDADDGAAARGRRCTGGGGRRRGRGKLSLISTPTSFGLYKSLVSITLHTHDREYKHSTDWTIVRLSTAGLA